MRAQFKLLALLVTVFLSSHALADSYVYVVTGAAQFGTVDVNNGAFNAIGSPLASTNGGLVQGAEGSLLTLGTDGNLYSINPSTGALTALAGSPFAAGNGPFPAVTDPSGHFLYIGNYNESTVSAFMIDPISGALTAVPGSPFTAGSGPGDA